MEALEVALDGAGVTDLESLLLPLPSPAATWEISGSCDIVIESLVSGWVVERRPVPEVRLCVSARGEVAYEAFEDRARQRSEIEQIPTLN